MVAINKSMLALLLCMLSANSFSEKMVETGDSDKPEQILDTVVVTGVRDCSYSFSGSIGQGARCEFCSG